MLSMPEELTRIARHRVGPSPALPGTLSRMREGTVSAADRVRGRDKRRCCREGARLVQDSPHDYEIGHFALVLALCIAAVQAVLPLIGAARGDALLIGLARPAAIGQFLFVGDRLLRADARLCASRFLAAQRRDQFAAATKPMLYKITGVWGNHEGSMLLWVFMLALFGAAVALFGRNLPPALRARVLAVQAMIGVGFLLFILLTSNPFLRLVPAPADGNGLNPLLQDPRPRLPSALPLSRLCRLLDRVLLRRRRADRGPGRRGLGALGAALDARRLVRADHRHRDGQLVGLLHARLGRLVVLGPGRERLVHAVAGRHRAAALRDRRREARRAEELDHPARDHRPFRCR